MSLVKFNQPKMLSGRRNWIENFFSETDDFSKSWDWDRSNNVPAVNVHEDEKFFFIEVAAPGMKKADFKVELEKGVLMISAKTEENKEEKSNGYVRQEFNFPNFQRSFWMPESVNTENILASYAQGVLQLKLPKINVPFISKSKSIPIS